MANDSKDTIYIDPEDEITTVIDKVLDSGKKMVALVLPSRASVFQSIVNMKLLKRKSTEAGKNIVLVTNESSLLPLAGAVGLHVAKTLSSKPEIPVAPVINAATVEAAEDEKIPENLEPSEEDTLKKLGKEEIGKTIPAKGLDSDLDAIELDNTEGDDTKPTDTAMPAVALAAVDKNADKKKSKKLKVPNFERFRVIAILGGLAIVVLVILWILMFKVWPHATVDIKTNAQNINATASFILDPSATSLNQASGEIPAKLVSETKTYTATVNATGTQNNGQTATGSVTLALTNCSQPTVTIPAGTGIVSNNLTYITQSTVTLTSVQIGNKCDPNSESSYYTGQTNITAQSPGSSYNVTDATFSVPGQTNVSGTGSTSGGTDDIVTIVSQTDVTNAENKISTDSSGAKSDLTSDLTQVNYYPIYATFVSGTPNISPNASAGTAANSVTVTETVKYSMYGTVKQDLVTLLNSNILSQAGKNQNILNNGFSSASYSVGSNLTSVTISSNAIVGPNISAAALKQEIKGLKVGAIESLIKNDPDVSSVSVKLSPFYVSTAPGPSHITINIAKPANSPSNASQ